MTGVGSRIGHAPTYAPSVWKDLAGYGRTIRTSYRKNYWEDQPCHVEVWLEKDSVSGSLEPVTDELGVTMRAARGFNSTTRIREIAQHLVSIDKPKFIYYLGDHDPSGKAMDEDLRKRVLSQCIELSPDSPIEEDNGDPHHSWHFHFERLAIFTGDIKKYNLPPLLIKRDDDGNPTDSRSEKYLAEHGDICVELDALPPDVLRERVRNAIEKHKNQTKWDRAILVEKAELASINAVVGKWAKKTIEIQS